MEPDVDMRNHATLVNVSSLPGPQQQALVPRPSGSDGLQQQQFASQFATIRPQQQAFAPQLSSSAGPSQQWNSPQTSSIRGGYTSQVSSLPGGYASQVSGPQQQGYTSQFSNAGGPQPGYPPQFSNTAGHQQRYTSQISNAGGPQPGYTPQFSSTAGPQQGYTSQVPVGSNLASGQHSPPPATTAISMSVFASKPTSQAPPYTTSSSPPYNSSSPPQHNSGWAPDSTVSGQNMVPPTTSGVRRRRQFQSYDSRRYASGSVGVASQSLADAGTASTMGNTFSQAQWPQTQSQPGLQQTQSQVESHNLRKDVPATVKMKQAAAYATESLRNFWHDVTGQTEVPQSDSPNLASGLLFTKTGMLMVYDEPDVSSGMNPNTNPGEEHDKKPLGFFATSDEIIAYYDDEDKSARGIGLQVVQYFNFLKFIMMTNVVFFGLSLISYGPHLAHGIPRINAAKLGPSHLSGSSVFDFLFIATYQPSNDDAWTAMVTLTTTFSFALPFLYFLYDSIFCNNYVPGQFEYKASEDFIDENRECQGLSRKWRLVLSYFVFVLCLCVPIVIMWAVLWVLLKDYMQRDYDFQVRESMYTPDTMQTLLGALVSLTVTISNLIFEIVVSLLTSFEKHLLFRQFRRHRIFKLMTFRLFNIIALFSLRYFADVPWFTCMSSRIGYQVFLFIILDLTVNNLVEFGVPFLMTLYNTLTGNKGAQSNEKSKPEFELTDEYFEVVYRQYIMFMSVSVFPLITLLTLCCDLVEYPLDKLRLTRICQAPKGYMAGGSVTISLFLLLAAIAALVTFPAGPIWFAAPVGPYLCWPCDMYSATKTAAGGVCLPEFETAMCRDSLGKDLPSDTLRTYIDRLKSSNRTVAEAADAWFRDNEHLFHDRRCNCRPCVAAISCPCNKPFLADVCDRQKSTNKCIDADGTCAASNTSCAIGKGCGANQEYVDAQCYKTRDMYSLAESKSYKPVCDGGSTKAGQSCSSHSDCPGGSCLTYCPTPRTRDAKDWTNTETCWNCVETLTSGLINPAVAKTSWENLTFCSRCVQNPCVCNKDCKVAYS